MEAPSPVHPATAIRHVATVVVVIAFAMPAVFVLTGSLRSPGLPPPRSPELVPDSPTLRAYGEAFDLVDLVGQLTNSAVVALVATPLGVVCASLAGYVIVRGGTLLRRSVVALSVLGVVVPTTALLVGQFVVFRRLGVLDSYVPLVAPALIGVNSLAVLLFGWAYSKVPRELFDAADLDGLPPWTSWRSIAVPLTRPMTVAVATIAFAVTWSDFVRPLVFITSDDRATVPLGLRSLQLVGAQDLSVLLAASVVACLPVVIVFVVAQRWLGTAVGGAGERETAWR